MSKISYTDRYCEKVESNDSYWNVDNISQYVTYCAVKVKIISYILLIVPNLESYQSIPVYG